MEMLNYANREFLQGLQDLGVQDPKKVQSAVNALGLQQFCQTSSGLYVVCTTQIPSDNSKPQITEGDNVLSRTITPINAADKLWLLAVLHVSCDSPGTIVAGLFQNSTADAISSARLQVPATMPLIGGLSADGGGILVLSHYMTAGTTSTLTFSVRMGPASAMTAYLNGNSGGSLFDGVFCSSLNILEVK